MAINVRAQPRVAFYALRPGGWRDYWTLLHPPYTLWHLAYVVLGAATAPVLGARELAATLLAFFLAVGVSAHALDEWQGRPLRTAIPAATLLVMAAGGLAGALALGVLGVLQVSWALLPFMAAGALLVLAYNLEVAGGRLHTDWTFAAGWGAFPVLTAAFAQDGTLPWASLPVAAGAFALSLAQRRLSARARRFRRRLVRLEGRAIFDDGSLAELNASWFHAPQEAALRWLAIALPFLAVGAAAARWI